VFNSTAGPTGWHILTYYLTTRKTYLLSSGPFDVDPDWSTDKDWIVYVRGVPPNPNLQLWRMRYDGSGKKRLSPDDKSCQGPHFSPDGRRVLFGAQSSQRWDLVVIDTSGAGWEQLTTPETVPFYYSASFAYPTWDRTGNKVLFYFRRIDTGQRGLAILDLRSKDLFLLSSLDSLQPYDPVWSPVRDEIAFVGMIPGLEGPKIFRANADGRDLLQLTDSWGSYYPDFSGDGEMIVYTSKESLESDEEIWTMRRDGSNKKKIIEARGYGQGQPAW